MALHTLALLNLVEAAPLLLGYLSAASEKLISYEESQKAEKNESAINRGDTGHGHPEFLVCHFINIVYNGLDPTWFFCKGKLFFNLRKKECQFPAIPHSPIPKIFLEVNNLQGRFSGTRRVNRKKEGGK